MKRFLILLILCPIFAFAHIPTNGNNPTLAPMLAKITPAVVNIAVERIVPPNQLPFDPKEPGARPRQPQRNFGVGSGVIFEAKSGLIVTNAHVIQNQRIMIVTLKDGRHFRAKLIGKDEGFDIAIIKIHAPNLKALNFADSDKLKVGDFVAAIGSPFGLTQTVTSGVISALNRSEPKIEGFQSFIQTDAPINPGNSGGALVNLQGELVGVPTAIITPVDASIGIGFSIPSNMVHAVITQLLKYGKVERGMLGVIAQNVSPELADAMHLKTNKGTLVTTIVPGSPAAKAGVRQQDIINKIDGRKIRNSVQLRNMLGLMRPGTKISLSVTRDHKQKSLTATIGDPTKFKPPDVNPFLAGLRLQNLSELEGDGTILKGVQITNMTDISSGALGGLRIGDVITMANGKPVTDIKHLTQLASESTDHMLVKVQRDVSAVYLVLQP